MDQLVTGGAEDLGLPASEADHPWETAPGMAAVAPQAGAPRLGFAGVGWIGRLRMEALLASGAGRVVAIADPRADLCIRAAERAPDAIATSSFADLLDMDLDGIVIATPNALHCEQTLAALGRGVAVFCQKPLARSAEETRQVVRAARVVDRLLGVDLILRSTLAAQALRASIAAGDLGDVYAGRLSFVAASGPDKAWWYDRAQSGGGCALDLGTDLVDLLLWLFGGREIARIQSRLFDRGRRLGAAPDGVEDYATIDVELAGGAVLQVSCGWNLPAGCDAVIEATLYGTAAGASLRNVGGSLYDLECDLCTGASRRWLCRPPDEWGGRALVDWAERLGSGEGYDESVEDLVAVAEAIDRVYSHAERGAP